MLVLVVFYALHAPRDQAALGGWVIGALADMMTLERFGLLAICYGLSAVAAGAVREALFTKHFLTQFSVTLASAVLVLALSTVYRLAVGLGAGLIGPALIGCVYTAAWAPFAHSALLKAPRLLGLHATGSLRGRALSARGDRV